MSAAPRACPSSSAPPGTARSSKRASPRASRDIAVLVAPNTSIGVAVAQELVRIAARALPAEFDIEIVEAHHKHKLDAPSGTALALADSAAKARGLDPNADTLSGRAGQGARRDGEIGIASIRAGRYRGYPYSAVRRVWGAPDGRPRGHRPVDLCPWRDPGGGLACDAKARPIHHGQRTWIKNNRLARFSLLRFRTFQALSPRNGQEVSWTPRGALRKIAA